MGCGNAGDDLLQFFKFHKYDGHLGENLPIYGGVKEADGW